MFRFVTVLVLSLSGVLSAASFQGLGDLPGGSYGSGAWAISEDGSTVVGASDSANGQEAFRWTLQDGMVPLGDLPGGTFQSIPTATSGDGSIVAGVGTIGDTPTQSNRSAFRWTSAGGIVPLESSVVMNNQTYTFQTMATDMSCDGSVTIGKANYSQDPIGGGPFDGDRPCYWGLDGQMHLLTPPGYGSFSGAQADAVSSDGRIVLISTNYGPSFTWSESGGFAGLPVEAGIARYAYLMSDNAAVFGSYGRDGYSYIWSQEDGLTIIGSPDGWDENWISCMNDDGAVVGGYLRTLEYYTAYDPQYMTAYLWDEINGVRLVEDILTEAGIDLGDWMLTGVSDISADGTTICGWGMNPDGFEEAWVVTIPEPATIVMLSVGALVVIRKGRSR